MATVNPVVKYFTIIFPKICLCLCLVNMKERQKRRTQTSTINSTENASTDAHRIEDGGRTDGGRRTDTNSIKRTPYAAKP